MSTYAAIFLKDEKTGLYNGISVKYDGYINGGVGEILHQYWQNREDVEQLCNSKKTDMKMLGETLESSDWFNDENPTRSKSFKNLSFNQMLKKSANISYNYTYVYEDYVDGGTWFIIDRKNNDSLDLLSGGDKE